MAGIGRAIAAGAKVLKNTKKTGTQTRKQVSKEGFDNSKVKTGNVKVTKVKKPTTPKKPKTTPKKTPAKKTPAKKTPAKKAPVKKSPKSTLSAPVKKVTKTPVKKTAKKTARKTPAKKVAKKKTAKKTTTSTPRNAGGTSERAGIGGSRSTRDTLKGSGGKQETRLAKVPKKPKKPKKKGPSANAKKNARRKKLLKFIRNERSLTGKAIRGGKTAVKKGGIPALSVAGGYMGGRMGSSGNVADTAKQKTTGFTQAELDAARMRYYGGR